MGLLDDAFDFIFGGDDGGGGPVTTTTTTDQTINAQDSVVFAPGSTGNTVQSVDPRIVQIVGDQAQRVVSDVSLLASRTGADARAIAAASLAVASDAATAAARASSDAVARIADVRADANRSSGAEALQSLGALAWPVAIAVAVWAIFS